MRKQAENYFAAVKQNYLHLREGCKMGVTCMKISESTVKSNAHGITEKRLDFFWRSHSCLMNANLLSYWLPLKALLWLLQTDRLRFQRSCSESPQTHNIAALAIIHMSVFN